MKTSVYNSKGKEERKIDLPESVFGLPFKSDLVHQVVNAILANKRNPIAHTKGRSDVRGGGRKPWRQKGTGRARHGSIRSPIWRGGGVTFGPTKDRNFSQKVNKKMKTKALFSILSKKQKDGEVLFVDNLEMKEPKTKDAKEILTNLSKVKGFETILSKRKNSALIAFGIKNKNGEKSFNNFGNLEVTETRNLNPAEILQYKHLIIVNPKESLEFLTSKIEK